ncbi:MAG: D-alanyl-D-alanine carboxypeptidase [Clostridia bacterium]|nr:D-alanyl-D-alanine carboxypeptidase [Clostridia bacterium]
MTKQINKIFLCIIFALAFLLTIPQTPQNITLAQTSARAMCVIESQSGRVLNGKNISQKLAMASTTKIMTAITAIENCKDLDKTFEISPKAVGISGTSLYLRQGERMTTRDLLYGLMLISGNDASVAIGEYVGGNTKNFVNMMNETAKKIGALNTHFDNTHGLDSKTHYTTAYDLALITAYALKNPTFEEIVSTQNIKITNEAGKTRYLKNKNKLLTKMEGCNGVKTGFTNDAGRCLVSSCKRGHMTLVCVVLNCGPMFEESQTLLEDAFSKYKLYNLTQGYKLPKTIQVEEGRKEDVAIGTNKAEYLYPLTEEELSKVNYVYSIEKSLKAPVEKGQEVGKVKIFIDNDLHFEEKIYTIESVRRNSVWEKVKDLLNNW